jgi:hypothetical protein
MIIGLAGFSFLLGLFVLCVELPRVRKQHIVVCEQGLLEVKQKHRTRSIRVIYWKDILSIKKFYNGYYVAQRGEAFFLDILYQGVGELIALIKTRSGKV